MIGDSEKVFKKINFQISKNDIEHIITCTPDSIERVLKVMKVKIEQYLDKMREKEKIRAEEENMEAYEKNRQM